ncbi:MAG: MarR family winged helix-turn-helix transcriptional regulator [Rhodospirillales bacterium]|jgi:DNA-binding MarR family transcriptional regulator
MDINQTANCACFNLRKAARAVTQSYDEALKPIGLRATQLSVLNVIAIEGPAAMSELAQILVMDRTTLTRNIKPLMDKGYLKSVTGEDRRQRPIAITTKGKNQLKKALPYWQQAQKNVAAGLGMERLAELLNNLKETINLTYPQ